MLEVAAYSLGIIMVIWLAWDAIRVYRLDRAQRTRRDNNWKNNP